MGNEWDGEHCPCCDYYEDPDIDIPIHWAHEGRLSHGHSFACQTDGGGHWDLTSVTCKQCIAIIAALDDP